MKILFCSLIGLALPVLARDKTDVLVMRNGDRITCEVKKLEGGVLEVGLDYVDGNISIDWKKVARIESDALFVVQLQNGATYAGKVITPDVAAGAPAKLEIQQVGAEEPIDVPPGEIVRITQTSTSLTQRLNGGINLGLQYSKGNSTTQYNLSSDLTYQETLWATTLRYSSSLSSSSGADTATRYQADLGGYHLLPRPKYFLSGSAGYLHSSVQGIQSQISLGSGIGKFLKNSNRIRLTGIGGMGWQRTHYVQSEVAQGTQNLGVFLISSNLEAFRFKKARLNANGGVAPAFTDPGRIFGRVNASYYIKLLGTFDLNFSVYGKWDNRPPAQLSGSDYGTSTGFSWSFGNH